MIHVIATIEVAENCRDAFLAEVRKIVPLVREEQGCIDYQPACDLATNISAQPAERSNVVVMIERWDDLECLEAHLIAPHMVKYRESVKQFVNNVTLQVLQPV